MLHIVSTAAAIKISVSTKQRVVESYFWGINLFLQGVSKGKQAVKSENCC